jgi:ketosteroid isomerase-like protein
MGLQELAMQYSKAWADQDPDAIAGLYTDDSVFHLHGDLAPAVGRDAIRSLAREFFALAPDLRFDARTLFFAEEQFVVEYLMSGTAAGAPFACDGADVITVRDGKVARKDTYLDFAAYLRQAGPLPASFASGNRIDPSISAT